MARLFINTNLQSVVLVGAWCGWDIGKAIYGKRKKNRKTIIFDDVPSGEYRILCCKSFLGGEVYPTDGRQMPNRYFNGNQNETIYCYFEKENTNEHY